MQTSTPISLLLFTQTSLEGRVLFRAARVQLALAPGAGRVLLDVAGGATFDPSWQAALRHIGDVARARYDLPWDARDLVVTCPAAGLVLEGASASLPLFVAWTALVARRALPEPFFATGAALDGGGALVPAPRDQLQGALDFADAYLRRTAPSRSRATMWVPAGSSYDAAALSALVVREAPTLAAAADAVLGLSAREGAAS